MNVIRPREVYDFNAGADVPPFAWVPLLASFLRRSWWTILLGVAAAMALASVYVILATPKFTATTQLLIDTRQGNAFQQQTTTTLDSMADNAIVESQVEVLRSDGTARHVVRQLRLTEDRAFLSWNGSIARSLLGRLTALIEPAPARAPAPEDGTTQATERLQSMVSIRRIGLSNVIEVSVRSPDAARSAQLANAITAAYIEDTLQAKYDITRQAGAWLQDRLKELRDQSTSADRALQEQKARIGIVDTDKGGMNEQQLGDLTLQLGNARARTAETAARYSRIQVITAAGLSASGSVVDALANPIVLKLQQQYLDDARRLVEWTAKYGPQHAAVIELGHEMAGLQASLGDELRRIQETYRSDYDVARSNEATLQQQVDGLIAISTATNGARAQMRALESLADTYRALYGSFLQRYTQAAQDQSFPISQARTVSPATPPLRKSAPATLLVMLGSMALGLGAGLAAALLREVTDRRFQTAAQIRDVLGLDCLGLLPLLREPARKARRTILARAADPHTIPRHPALLRAVVDQTLSPFAYVVRRLGVRLVNQRSRSRPTRVIGIVSAAAGEGKSTLAANLAHLLAQSGQRTVLIDWDLRTPQLSRWMAPGAIGFDEVAQGRAGLDDALLHDPQTALAFLPAPAPSTEPLNTAHAAALLDMVKQRFDFLVVDLPPLATLADAQAAAPLMDSFIVVIEWCKTQQQTVIDGLEAADIDADRLLGVVVNKVDLAALRRYSPTPGRHYRPAHSEMAAG